MEEEENKLLKQAKEELAYLSGDPDFKRLVDSRVRFLRDQNTEKRCAEERGEKRGEKRGIKKGKVEEKIEIAKKMLAKDMKIEDIMELTNLTKEEIKKLQK